MKRLETIIAVALAALFYTACSSEVLPAETLPSLEGDGNSALKTETIRATVPVGETKAAIGDDLAFSWTAGDQIAIHTDNDGGEYYYSNEIGTGGDKTAAFTVSYSGSRNGYAIYPASLVSEGEDENPGQVTIFLPPYYSIYNLFSTESPMPMIAEDPGSGDLNFYHVGALLRLFVNDAPSGASKIDVVFNSTVTGYFQVPSGTTPGDSDCVISTSSSQTGNTVTFYFSALAAETDGIILNVPIPTGAYSGLSVIARDGSNTALASDTPLFSWEAARKRGKKITANLQ